MYAQGCVSLCSIGGFPLYIYIEKILKNCLMKCTPVYHPWQVLYHARDSNYKVQCAKKPLSTS